MNVHAITAETTTLRYLGIDEDIALKARASLRDRFGHTLRVVKAQAPCRVCLRIPGSPDPLILLSYRPLPDTGPYAEVGPIFMHADWCKPYAEDAFPPDFEERRLILRGYGYDGRIIDAVIAEPGQAVRCASRLFDCDDIAEIHVRHETYTCFDFKIVRS